MAAAPEISPEDDLRLNLTLAQQPAAVRIDESGMIACALTGKGEARVELNPNCRDEIYLRRAKSMLSSHVMDAPDEYPVS